uniref:Uncharacterized protein n=1 Tax=Ixodes ricinus TaxID=34613 RepID=A0A0K8R956_IXORI
MDLLFNFVIGGLTIITSCGSVYIICRYDAKNTRVGSTSTHLPSNTQSFETLRFFTSTFRYKFSPGM